jgi:hypothetical protein
VQRDRSAHRFRIQLGMCSHTSPRDDYCARFLAQVAHLHSGYAAEKPGCKPMTRIGRR